MNGIADFVPPTAHRALAYVDALNRQGYQPSVEEVENFATQPVPNPAKYENFWQRMTVGSFPLKERLTEPAEPVVGYMFELGWLQISSEKNRIGLTDSGVSLLRALAQADEDADETLQVTLDPKDHLVYTKLTRIIASAKDGLLADGYFKAEFIPWLVNATTVSRLLVNDDKSERVPLALALGQFRGTRVVEVRATKDKALHDRCLIPPVGEVLLFGHSINRVGKTLTTMIPLRESAGDSYRRQYEALWQKATIVEPAEITKMSTPPGVEDGTVKA